MPAKIMKAIDAFNSRYGRDTLVRGVLRQKAKWEMLRNAFYRVTTCSPTKLCAQSLEGLM